MLSIDNVREGAMANKGVIFKGNVHHIEGTIAGKVINRYGRDTTVPDSPAPRKQRKTAPDPLEEASAPDANRRAPSSRGAFSYDVALSFASADRGFAEALADGLRRRGIVVFLDSLATSALWGEDLYSYLADIYQNRARFCVMLLSRHYLTTPWTKLERTAAQARALTEKQAYILPIRLDDTQVPGLLSTVAWLSSPPETVESICTALVDKLNNL